MLGDGQKTVSTVSGIHSDAEHRTAKSELLGLLNSDIDLDNKTLTVRQGVKEVSRRNDTEFTSGREIKIGKPKSTAGKCTVPLNKTAIEMIEDYARKPTPAKIRPLWPTRTAVTLAL